MSENGICFLTQWRKAPRQECSAPTANRRWSASPSRATTKSTAGASSTSPPTTSSRATRRPTSSSPSTPSAPHTPHRRQRFAASASRTHSGRPWYPVACNQVRPRHQPPVQVPFSQCVKYVDIRDHHRRYDCPRPIHDSFSVERDVLTTRQTTGQYVPLRPANGHVIALVNSLDGAQSLCNPLRLVCEL